VAILVKPIYEPAAAQDGFRILVDRLWPRGISKERAQLGLWMRDIAPSNELRKWFGHEAAKWPEFQERYRAELATRSDLLDSLLGLEQEHQVITLLFGARDQEHNEAMVLLDVLNSRRLRRALAAAARGASATKPTIWRRFPSGERSFSHLIILPSSEVLLLLATISRLGACRKHELGSQTTRG